MAEWISTELLLDWMIAYGSPVIAALLFLAALGLPTPASVIVVVAGALARMDYMDPVSAGAFALAGIVAGDSLTYAAGRFAARFQSGGQARLQRSAAYLNARSLVERFGGWAVFLTRWLITPPATPTTLLAGSANYPFAKFLLYDVTGELIWIVLYGGLGYAFGSQWEKVSAAVSQASTVVLFAALAATGGFLLARYWKARSALVVAIQPGAK